MFSVHYERKAQFYETDAMGIVHHTNYIRWFEEARCAFMDKLGFSYRRCMDMGIDIALLGVSCEYKSMVRFADVVDIESHMTDYSETRMTVAYTVTDIQTGRLCTLGQTRHCFLSRSKGRPVSIRRELPALHEAFAAYTAQAPRV